ncbi:MAG: hypothetical protein V1912_10170, partial [bacterium]
MSIATTRRVGPIAAAAVGLLLFSAGMGCGGSAASDTTAGPATTVGATTTVPLPTGTTAVTGTTIEDGQEQMRSLTFVGPMSLATWLELRRIVMDAGDDGQMVLDRVAEIAAGDPISVGMRELDAYSGIGFSAGAGTSQPIGVASLPDDGEALVYAFTVPAVPESTT